MADEQIVNKKNPLVKQPASAPVQVSERVRAGDVIRFVETNLDGSKPVATSIRGIKGVSFMFANAVALRSGFSSRRLNDLSETELNTLEDIILNPSAHSLPLWLVNRRSDPFTGGSSHLTASSLDLSRKTDINEMKRIKSYKGVRHAAGLPVRGQRTRNTSRTGKSVGVQRDKKKAEAKAAAAGKAAAKPAAKGAK